MQSSVQFSHSVVSNSLRPHELQHTRPPCPSPTPGVHSDSHPSSPWCHPAISSSVVPFSSCPKSLPASKSFPMSQLFAWGGQSTGVKLKWESRRWTVSEHNVLIKRRNLDTDTYIQGECCVDMKAGIKKMQLQPRKIRDCQQIRSQERWDRFPLIRNQACQHPGLLASRIARQKTSVVLI